MFNEIRIYDNEVMFDDCLEGMKCERTRCDCIA